MLLRRVAVVLAVVVAVACGGEAPAPASTSVPAASAGHAHEAPHGGALVELGDHFGFLEFVLDANTGTLTAYVLDGGTEQAVRISQPSLSVTMESPVSLSGQTLVLAAKANVLTGETVGDTSQFVVTHGALKGQTALAARIVEVTVKGQIFRDLMVKYPK